MTLRQFTAPVALVPLGAALLLAGCGSRLAQHTIAAAAQRAIVRSGAAPGTPTASGQANGSSANGASTTPSTDGAGASSTDGTTLTGSNSTSASNQNGGAGSPTQPASGSATLSTINLGNVGTYSGVIGAIFSGAQQAMQIWQAYVNAHGGLNGHPVHLVMEDDGGDPSTNETDVQQEVTEDHVIAFVGNLEPLTAAASVDYLQQQRIPEIGGDASSYTWWQSPMLFPQASYIGQENDATVKQAISRGDTKMALLYCIEDTTCANAYNQLIQQGGAKAAGIDPVYTSTFSITQPDFTAQCLDAKQAGANFVYFAGDGDSLVRMASDCVAQSYKPLYLADSIAVNSTDGSDPNLNGLVSIQTDFPWMDSFTPAQAAYQQAVRQYDPGLISSGPTAAEWTAGMLAVAADKYLTANPTSTEFLQGLWSIKNNDLGGLAPPLTFNQNALPSQSNCFFAMQLRNGQFVDLNNGNVSCQ